MQMNKIFLLFLIIKLTSCQNKFESADKLLDTESIDTSDPELAAYVNIYNLLKSHNSISLLNFLQHVQQQTLYQIPPPVAYPPHPPQAFQRLNPNNNNNYDRYGHMQQKQNPLYQAQQPQQAFNQFITPPAAQSSKYTPAQTYKLQTSQSSSYMEQTLASSEGECGIIKPALGNYVSGGYNSAPTAYPWHVQLNIAGNNKSDSETYCGASLINKKYILTAAHCYDDLAESKRARNTQIIMKGIEHIQPKQPSYAAKKYSQQQQQEVRLRASNVYLHPKYVPAMTESEARARGVVPGPVNDIAIIEIKQDLLSNEVYQRLMPICLPDQDTHLHVGLKCKIMGHGFMNAHDEDNFVMPSILQVADVHISSNQACRDDVESQSIKSKINGDTVCVRGPIHPCVGDSGGPLLCTGKSGSNIDGQVSSVDFDLDYEDDKTNPLKSKWFLTGVTSFAVSTDEHDRCGQFKSAVFTRVSNFIQWINTIVKK